jgi:Protein of unknown function (DUF3027)
VIVSPVRGKTKEPDEACAQAVELARHAAEELAGPAMVGEHLAVTADGDRLVTHTFRCLLPAYRGWCWAVTVARASRAKTVTVSENVLLPGPEAVLAPDWVPWRDRLRPGDLGVGDLLPAPPDDPRLVLAATLAGDDGLAGWGEAAWALPGAEPEDLVPLPSPPLDEPALDESLLDEPMLGQPDLDELGLDEPGLNEPGLNEPGTGESALAEAGPAEPAVGSLAPSDAAVPVASESGEDGTAAVRARVMSAAGRDDAAFRWYTSEHGPKSPLANAAPGLCAGCGFFVRLAGPLGRVFGACANEYAPDDGRVVSADHGCGAHSESVFPPSAEQSLRPVIDELGYDLVDMPGVSFEETVFEPLDHN